MFRSARGYEIAPTGTISTHLYNLVKIQNRRFTFMRALITGASSGIGMSMAQILSERGFELTLTARREERLTELATRLPTHCEVIPADLSDERDCIKLYKAARGDDLKILINNAGFGLFGEFTTSSLHNELRMIDTNIRAVHILTKLAVCDFVAHRQDGYVLNVASTAGFMPGPLMATYYASKNYVLRFTEAVREEMRRAGNRVKVCALCPGPVDTEFNSVAGVSFSLSGLSADRVAAEGIEGMFADKGVIIPGLGMKALVFARRFASEAFLAKIAYHIQHRKAVK